MGQTKVPTDALREKQVREAEELLFAGPQKLGLAKGLFLGRFVAGWVVPYPGPPPQEGDATERAVSQGPQFLGGRLRPGAPEPPTDNSRAGGRGFGRPG